MLIWQRKKKHLKRHLKSSHSKNQPIHEINSPSPSDATSAPPPFRQNGSLPAAAPPPRRCGRRHSRCPEVAGRGGRCDTRRPNAPVTGSTLPSPWWCTRNVAGEFSPTKWSIARNIIYLMGFYRDSMGYEGVIKWEKWRFNEISMGI